MKAVRVGGDGSVSVVDVPKPRIGEGEALLRTRAVGICGSDLLDWYVRKKADSILGHEVAGEIVEVGAGVHDFAAGDRVACVDIDLARSEQVRRIWPFLRDRRIDAYAGSSMLITECIAAKETGADAI